MDDLARRHLEACERFGAVLSQVDGRWAAATPCHEWDVRGVVEHVIGFHDVLLLRPLAAKPDRPRDDPRRRWTVTVTALRGVLGRPGLFERVVEVPAVGHNAPMTIDARSLVPSLTQDVLVHAWDVARAIGADDPLDERLCAAFLAGLPADGRLERSGMYAAPVAVPADAGSRARLLARLGRDPNWTNP